MASLFRTCILRSARAAATFTGPLKSSFGQATPITTSFKSLSFISSPCTRLILNNYTRSFSTTSIRSLSRVLLPLGNKTRFKVDQNLAEQLAYEIKTETESSSYTPDTPDFIKEFLNRQTFKIEDKAGHDEVAITRTFGNETLRLLFSVSEVTSSESSSDSFSDEDDYDSDGDDSVSDENAEDEDDDLSEGTFPIRCVLTQAKGALAFELTCEDGVFIIDSISYYKDGNLANDLTVEGDWQRRRLYLGPRFENLDNEVQILFERYLEERGIDTSLALFIPNYVDYKEQKEYLGWLHNVKKFVEA
ncbi:7197_t:CDS:2 [Ambispora gerdemannii]|uniref:7197_t:CDS:1 n=1 Tax=Ambispora gerdemannii TaxID=144530 RepID=A0A9N8ZWZ0_9GLOM|nr:7197_t:CDS:2 [Ambispora gerdemannii]